ncbi:unnamed protein product [Diabrotica balteata]|uniref:Double jelly roll-like domain-containing protein n=1 Tax=Diabrotica balteata TaxID=107213 RepID=A0A9N9XIE4_DIABA|nr:unnamed protein product [Diabrotica balteata]
MNGSILNVNKTVPVDESIISSEYHTHLPYSATSLDNNDEIRVPIQSQNIYTYPSKSYIILEGNLISQEKNHYSPKLSFINNGPLHLFEECRYELGGTIIVRSRFPGITSTLKGYASFTPNDCIKNANSGWCITEHPKIIEQSTGKSEPCLTPTNFIQKAPIFVIDCSHQNEAVKGGAIDVRLELEASENFPGNTSVYCLIIHDRTVIYNPLSNLVKVQ